MAKYIAYNFGKAAALRFQNTLQKNIQQLSIMPGLGSPVLNRPPYRTLVIHRNCRLFYYTTPNALVIADVWDTRQEGWEG